QSEWTGAPLSLLLRETGVESNAKWFLAEGGDSCLLARSIPIDKAYDDALIAWAQNGEPLRPEQGFPIRLLLPGFEGNTNVKWLRRIKLGTEPFMTRWETSKYTDPILGGKARQFSFEMDAKSIITSPSYPERISAPGWRAIRGLAWSGRGRITRVDVSTDGGVHWQEAALRTPSMPKAHVRFELPWRWTGDNSFLMSRATDETGYVQPTMAELRAARGPATEYHFNCIRGWRVARDGSVTFEANTGSGGAGSGPGERWGRRWVAAPSCSLPPARRATPGLAPDYPPTWDSAERQPPPKSQPSTWMSVPTAPASPQGPGRPSKASPCIG